MEELTKDVWWSKELEAARTAKQAAEVVEAYCREKGLKVKRVDLKGD